MNLKTGKGMMTTINDETKQAIEALTQAAATLTQAIALLTQQLEERSGERWLGINEAAAALGLTPKVLRTWQNTPEFKHGIHFRDISSPGSAMPRYQFNIPRCRDAIAKSPERRKAS
jgi:DNA-binding LacI/PurR family transcriptional regulator